MPEHSVDALAQDLRRLGIGEGDAVLVRASVKRIGAQGNAPKALIRALLEAVGSSGTILGLSFTKTYFLPNRHRDKAFDGSTAPITGGLAKAMVEWPGAVRSAHPTNSFVAIGRQAHELLADHDATKSCFHPMEHLIEAKGKMILVGCVHDSPGFSTVHLVQHHLGLSRKSVIGLFTGSCYRTPNDVRVFWRRDVPGCSAGFGNFYGHYVTAGKLRCGSIGDADSIAIAAADAYAIEYPLVRDEPTFPLCDNPDCEFCRGSLAYNVRDIPGFWMRHSLPILRRVFKSL